MGRRKPPPRVKPTRSRNNQKRELVESLPSTAQRADLAARARYGAYSKHKFHPTAYRLTPYAGPDEDRTFCDAHAEFVPADLPRVPRLLGRGIVAGLWGDHPQGEDPRLLWTVDDNGWIYELRITNAGQAEYHGYPVLPSDAFAKKVIERFASWYETAEMGLKQAYLTDDETLKAVRDRYR